LGFKAIVRVNGRRCLVVQWGAFVGWGRVKAAGRAPRFEVSPIIARKAHKLHDF
jgi:hypothetical protein